MFSFPHCVCVCSTHSAAFTVACEKNPVLLVAVFGLAGMDWTQAQFKPKEGKRLILCLIHLCLRWLFVMELAFFLN